MDHIQTRQRTDDADAASMLSDIPCELLEEVLANLDAATIARLLCLSRHYCRWIRLHAARRQLERRVGLALASRWRSNSYLERLMIEETRTSFDRTRCENAGFVFDTDGHSRVASVKLTRPGPKLLVSDLTTHDAPLLRWRMTVKGNNALVFGVVPVELQETANALQKCMPVPEGDNAGGENRGRRPIGFSSSVTAGSLTSCHLQLMVNSVVDILARRDRLEYIVKHPANGMHMVWQNNVTVPKPYTGPLEVRYEHGINPQYPYKLAVNCWAMAAFDVLHQPVLPAAVPHPPPAGGLGV